MSLNVVGRTTVDVADLWLENRPLLRRVLALADIAGSDWVTTTSFGQENERSQHDHGGDPETLASEDQGNEEGCCDGKKCRIRQFGLATPLS